MSSLRALSANSRLKGGLERLGDGLTPNCLPAVLQNTLTEDSFFTFMHHAGSLCGQSQNLH